MGSGFMQLAAHGAYEIKIPSLVEIVNKYLGLFVPNVLLTSRRICLAG